MSLSGTLVVRAMPIVPSKNGKQERTHERQVLFLQCSALLSVACKSQMCSLCDPCSTYLLRHQDRLWIGMCRHFKGKGLADLLDQQAKAKQSKLGVWQGSFKNPQDWRNDHKHPHA